MAGERLAIPQELRDEQAISLHGWQLYASSAIIIQHNERVVRPAFDDTTKARFRSEGEAEAGAFFPAQGTGLRMRGRDR